MPSPDAILDALTRAANDWRGLALVWHLLLAALAAALMYGWRPSIRVTAALLATPLVSVAATAWWSGNPFNGILFVALSVGLARTAVRLPAVRVRLESRASIVRAAAVVASGAVYPHFLRTESWIDYAVASPFGVIPCPTLMVVIGMTLAVANLRSGSWAVPLMVAGGLYAAVGVFVLGVALDWGLFVAVALLGAALVEARDWRPVRADLSERRRPLPGDDLIRDPLATFTHAITIRRDPRDVWPWLAQMGAGTRAGWYSYDWLDNGGRPSATHVMPALQSATIGTLFPALPGATDGFKALVVEPARVLVLGWPSRGSAPLVTWAFVLEPHVGTTRLLVRVRGAQDYRFHSLPRSLSIRAARCVHFVMQRRQLLGIARRAESMAVAPHPVAAPPPASERQLV